LVTQWAYGSMLVLAPCPRCGTPVRELTSFGRKLVLELQIDFEDSANGMRWLAHSEERCEFAGLMTANFG
jgi:hypothetical protein